MAFYILPDALWHSLLTWPHSPLLTCLSPHQVMGCRWTGPSTLFSLSLLPGTEYICNKYFSNWSPSAILHCRMVKMGQCLSHLCAPLFLILHVKFLSLSTANTLQPTMQEPQIAKQRLSSYHFRHCFVPGVCWNRLLFDLLATLAIYQPSCSFANSLQPYAESVWRVDTRKKWATYVVT